MSELQQWINSYLIKWGLVHDSANIWDNLVVLLLLIVITVGIDYTCRYIFLELFKRFAQKTKNQWDDLIVERKIINKLMHLIPAILVYIMLPLALPKEEMPTLLGVLQMVCSVYIVAVVLRFINASLNLLLEIYNRKESMKNKPLKGFVQIIQVIVFFVGGIIIISILIGKSPATLFAGLGASAAILMLVFKDTILGFVAGIQLSANDMLRPGDWITMSKYGADGTVIEVTLNAIKVRNFDNTITTIPPYALVSDSFQNWRGMQESGGRRVNKNIYLDMTTLKFCTPEDLDAIRKNVPLMADYQPAEGEVPTNSQLYRIYIERYLRSLPVVNQDMDLIISQKEPTTYGVPIQVYFFSRNKVWKEYERIQSDIFDHLLAMVPKFDLKVYQYSD